MLKFLAAHGERACLTLSSHLGPAGLLLSLLPWVPCTPGGSPSPTPCGRHWARDIPPRPGAPETAGPWRPAQRVKSRGCSPYPRAPLPTLEDPPAWCGSSLPASCPPVCRQRAVSGGLWGNDTSEHPTQRCGKASRFMGRRGNVSPRSSADRPPGACSPRIFRSKAAC